MVPVRNYFLNYVNCQADLATHSKFNIIFEWKELKIKIEDFLYKEILHDRAGKCLSLEHYCGRAATILAATGGETTKQNINQSSSSELHWTKLKNECSATKIEFIKKPTLLGGLSSAKVWAKSVFRITCTSIRIRVRNQADSDPCPASLIKIIIQYVVAVIIRSFCCFPEPSFFNPLVNFLRFTEWLLVFFASQVGSGKMMRIRSDTGRNLQQFVFL